MADVTTNDEPTGGEQLLSTEEMVAGLLGSAPVQGDTDSDPSPEAATPETTTETTTDTTAAPAAPAAAPAEAAPEPEPLGVLAADGKTVIPLSVLQQEREAARHWEKQARAFAEIADALAASRRAPNPDAPHAGAADPATTQAPTASASAAEIARLVADQVSRELEPIKRREHYGAIEAAHPDVKEIGANPAFQAWIEGHPSFVRDQYVAVRDGGSSAQVIEMLNAFKASQPKPAAAAAAPAPVAQTKEQLAAAAKAVVAGVKAAPPSSLSELPAGGAQVVDETTALLTMTPEAMREKFASKSPKEIEALLSRVL